MEVTMPKHRKFVIVLELPDDVRPMTVEQMEFWLDSRLENNLLAEYVVSAVPEDDE
jgi:hypothetical protein